MSQWTATWNLSFLSTLSLRRATVGVAQGADTGHISIHALLAESDISCSRALLPAPLFLSTLSLRRATMIAWSPDRQVRAFLSTLSLRRATPYVLPVPRPPQIFLSTLSLRRATGFPLTTGKFFFHFYPRSPCGERLSHFKTLRGLLAFLSTLSLRRATLTDDVSTGGKIISIHALLAESDGIKGYHSIGLQIFLSTLSLRRATMVSPTL